MVNPHDAPQLPAEGSYTHRPLRYTSGTCPFLYLCVPYSVGRELFGHVLKRPLSLNNKVSSFITRLAQVMREAIILLIRLPYKNGRNRNNRSLKRTSSQTHVLIVGLRCLLLICWLFF